VLDFSDVEARLRFFETVLVLGGELTMLMDETWTIAFANEAAQVVTGYGPEELVGLSAIDLIFPDDLEIVAAGIAMAESFDPSQPDLDGFGPPAHFRIVRKDGTPTFVAASTSNLRSHPDIGGVAVRLRLANSRFYVDQFLEGLMGGAPPDAVFEKLAMAVCDDVPDSRLALALDWDGQRYRTVMTFDLPEPLASLIDLAHDISPLALAVDPNELVVVHVDDLPATWRAAATVAGATACWIQAVERSDDAQRRTTMVLWRFTDKALEVNHELDLQRYANFARLALDRWARDAELHHAAHCDELTGLRNRAGFYGRLEAIVADPTEPSVCVLFIDLDGFKEINDRYGHAAGDEILQVVGRRIESTVRPSDVVARIGGDEFAVIALGITNAAAAEAVAHRVLSRFQEPIQLGDVAVLVGGSVGGSITGLDEPPDAVVERADRAMYDAKRAGRNLFRLDRHGLDACESGPAPGERVPSASRRRPPRRIT
jgi:diguanylate cyclase (GGDEF)-like protein/PAS domain S-box-containing protein